MEEETEFLCIGSLCPWEMWKEEIWVPSNTELCKFSLTQTSSCKQVSRQSHSQVDIVQLSVYISGVLPEYSFFFFCTYFLTDIKKKERKKNLTNFYFFRIEP